MSKVFKVAVVLVLMFCFVGIALARDVWVDGYYRKDGTYVKPHYRSSPNDTARDNRDYKGNINPYTGKKGSNYYRDNPTSEYYNPFYKYYKAPSYTPSYPSYKPSQPYQRMTPSEPSQGELHQRMQPWQTLPYDWNR